MTGLSLVEFSSASDREVALSKLKNLEVKDDAGGKISIRGALTFAQRGRNRDLQQAKTLLDGHCQGGEEISINWKDRSVLVENEVAFRQARGLGLGSFVGKWAELSSSG